MSTLFFANQELTIYRRRRISDTNRFNMSATFTGYPLDLQPATKERIEMFGGRFGAVFTGFLDTNVPIKEGDQVVITDTGQRFSVKGVQDWRGAGLLDYREVVLIAQDAY